MSIVENPSISTCVHPMQYTSHFFVNCPAADSAPLALWRLLFSLQPLVQGLGSCWAFRTPWSYAMPHSKRRVTTTLSGKVERTGILNPLDFSSVGCEFKNKNFSNLWMRNKTVL